MVETITIGFFRQLVRSIVLVPLGILLFLLSFLILWGGEGLPDRAELIERATVLEPNEAPHRVRGPATVTGDLDATERVGDSGFFADREWVDVRRVVEMYAWHEVQTLESEERLWGGRRRRTIRYDYHLEWTEAPPSHERFRVPDGHENPDITVPGAHNRAAGLRVGRWPIVGLDARALPGVHRLALDDVKLADRYEDQPRTAYRLYLGEADPAQPRPGDMRVSWYVSSPAQLVTVLGTGQAEGIAPYKVRRGVELIDVIGGDREAAQQVVRAEDVMTTWLFRITGFALLWGGLYLIFSIFICIFDIVPPLGTLARIVVVLVTLPVALLLTTVTIGLSIVGHDPWLTLGVLGTLLGVIFVLYYVWPSVRRDAARRKGL